MHSIPRPPLAHVPSRAEIASNIPAHARARIILYGQGSSGYGEIRQIRGTKQSDTALSSRPAATDSQVDTGSTSRLGRDRAVLYTFHITLLSLGPTSLRCHNTVHSAHTAYRVTCHPPGPLQPLTLSTNHSLKHPSFTYLYPPPTRHRPPPSLRRHPGSPWASCPASLPSSRSGAAAPPPASYPRRFGSTSRRVSWALRWRGRGTRTWMDHPVTR